MACLSSTSILSISNQSVGLVSTPNFCNNETIAKHSSDSYSSSVSSILLIPTPPPSLSIIRNKLRLRSQRRRTSPSTSHHSQRLGLVRAASSETMATEKLGIKILTNPPESKLTDLGVRSWPKWGCPPSKFPWTYSAKETCYLLKGKVKVYPDGCDEGVEIGAGDLVVFPKGMSCTWDVSETVDKHYNFE